MNYLIFKSKEMFEIERIDAAHRKVKSGADFPANVKEIKELGVAYYETFVADGHTVYYGVDDYQRGSLAKYQPLNITEKCRIEQFRSDLKAHQQGETDYPTFIKISADLGIEKWVVRVDDMTCTYYDKGGKDVLVENIPQ